jgi:phosphatidylglycerophosphatase A
LACIPFYLLFQGLVWWQYLIVTVIVALIGIYLCGRTCEEIGVHDHPGTVFDEFVGFFVTMLFAPAGWPWIVVGFILFRFFDIYKPWPISWLDQNLQGGLGVVLDDIVAGIFALVIMQIIAIPFH